MLPNVHINLGNGNLGRTTVLSDGIAGMILTGKEVSEKLVLNKHYQLSSVRDLTTLGVTSEENPLIDKEVKAFYTQNGEGAELHLLVVAEATTLTAMCAADGPLAKLMDAAGDRIRLLGINRIPPAEYEATITQGIDQDAIDAGAAAQSLLDSYAESQVRPARLFVPACGWDGTTEELFKPVEGSQNRVIYVMASDDVTNKTAAIGQVLGRAASMEVHQSLGRVRSGSIATDGWMTDGRNYKEVSGLWEILHDAGYVFYRGFPTRNGCYLNGCHMAAPDTDDYSKLNYGRVTDKAYLIIYNTLLDQLDENVLIESDGTLPEGFRRSLIGDIENAINEQMGSQISDFEVDIPSDQNILSSETITINGSLTPQGVTSTINFNFALKNPALS